MGRIKDDSPPTPDTDTPNTIHATTTTDIESGTTITNSAAATATPNQPLQQPNTWKGYLWDTWDLPQDQRRLLFKVDALVLTFSSIGYFLKNLDQTNVNNAFLSGMKEDLGMWGDELVTSKSSVFLYLTLSTDADAQSRRVHLDGGLCHRADPVEPAAHTGVAALCDSVAGGRVGDCHDCDVGGAVVQVAVCAEVLGWVL
jgi:hypothetical protein